MTPEIQDHLVARLVIPIEELQSIVQTSVQDFKSRSTTDEFDEAIEDFINRKNYENELVVLTDFAEEDWEMPIDFDFIFDVEDPTNFVETKVFVQHVVLERGLPSFYIDRGLRHLLLLEFENGIPELVRSLVGFEDENENENSVKRSKIGFGIF